MSSLSETWDRSRAAAKIPCQFHFTLKPRWVAVKVRDLHMFLIAMGPMGNTGNTGNTEQVTDLMVDLMEDPVTEHMVTAHMVTAMYLEELCKVNL